MWEGQGQQCCLHCSCLVVAWSAVVAWPGAEHSLARPTNSLYGLGPTVAAACERCVLRRHGADPVCFSVFMLVQAAVVKDTDQTDKQRVCVSGSCSRAGMWPTGSSLACVKTVPVTPCCCRPAAGSQCRAHFQLHFALQLLPELGVAGRCAAVLFTHPAAAARARHRWQVC